MDIKTRLDVTALFWEVDDFCQSFEGHYQNAQLLTGAEKPRYYRSRLNLSEVMTIVIAFHGSGARTFKDFYCFQVLPHWRQAFPMLVSYNRFIELMPWALMLLCCFLHTRRGKVTGISFIDSTPLEVCHPNRANAHRVFEGLVGWGKNSMGWHYGFKLHLIINDRGELLAFQVTPGNVDDRKPVPDLTHGLLGKLFGDRGYISQPLFEELFENGLQLITNYKQKMKQKLVNLMDKILLRKRALIETVNDQLKNICQIEHSRHRSPWNFMVNLVAGLIAYTYLPKKPSLNLHPTALAALSPVIL